jgi:hypothetical protein
MHLLPGLATFAHRYHTPPQLRGWRGLLGCGRAAAGALAGRGGAAAACGLGPGGGAAPALPPPEPLLAWLVAAPLAFYLAWQLFYFLVVQVWRAGGGGKAGLD